MIKGLPASGDIISCDIVVVEILRGARSKRREEINKSYLENSEPSQVKRFRVSKDAPGSRIFIYC